MSDRNAREALFARTGLPADLTFLPEKYPRTIWRQPGGLTEMSRFWLKRHALKARDCLARRGAIHGKP